MKVHPLKVGDIFTTITDGKTKRLKIEDADKPYLKIPYEAILNTTLHCDTNIDTTLSIDLDFFNRDFRESWGKWTEYYNMKRTDSGR